MLSENKTGSDFKERVKEQPDPKRASDVTNHQQTRTVTSQPAGNGPGHPVFFAPKIARIEPELVVNTSSTATATKVTTTSTTTLSARRQQSETSLPTEKNSGRTTQVILDVKAGTLKISHVDSAAQAKPDPEAIKPAKQPRKRGRMVKKSMPGLVPVR